MTTDWEVDEQAAQTGALSLQPVSFMTGILTVADVQGVSYLRRATPEYLRMIEHGTLRFLEEAALVAILFGGTVATAGYSVAIGRMIALWPTMVLLV